MWRAGRLRVRTERRLGSPVPSVVAISPTMRCNYDCEGCYSRGRATDDELTTVELGSLLAEAERLGVLAVALTGGEPLLRGDLVDLICCHGRLVFFLITNGALLTPERARALARSGNVVTLVSVEGSAGDTDGRRREGAHEAGIRALRLLREAGAIAGFSATITSANASHLASDEFVDGMVALGCSTGYFIEYVPCGPKARHDWVLEEGAAAAFKERLRYLRRRKPIVLSHFPEHEYGPDNRCTAAGRKSLHIGPRGDVEPCPFAPVSVDNIRRGGLMAAIRSPFMRAIRESPELLRRNRSACAMFEHLAEVRELSRQFVRPA
jgi:MoaA/NifB/PqqE/SkfB family radical SAM enzyme